MYNMYQYLNNNDNFSIAFSSIIQILKLNYLAKLYGVMDKYPRIYVTAFLFFYQISRGLIYCLPVHPLFYYI